MLERLTARSKTSGREDDNKESIVKRFREWSLSCLIESLELTEYDKKRRNFYRD